MTFTLGLPGSDATFLNQLAQAGGTSQSIDVTQGVQTFINALNSIRDTTAMTTSMQVVTSTVISTPLPCQWGVPPPPSGEMLDPQKVNLQFTPAPGAVPIDFGYVASEADCANTTNAWYYNNPTAPTEIFACPSTCSTITATNDGRVDLLFGCATQPAMIQ
jgi:hypothetical protein